MKSPVAFTGQSEARGYTPDFGSEAGNMPASADLSLVEDEGAKARAFALEMARYRASAELDIHD